MVTGKGAKRLYRYQEQALRSLTEGKHILVLPTGTGKAPVGVLWAEWTKKPRVLIVTTASKRDSHDFEKEAGEWCKEGWSISLPRGLETVSWNGFPRWWEENKGDVKETAFVFDEVAAAKAGRSSKRGTAFLEVAKSTDYWIGMTATAGDKWIDFYAYFTAAKKVRNKTDFLDRFCEIRTFKGYPEILRYRETDTLSEYWQEISTRPDASLLLSELPGETHRIIKFPRPLSYKKFMKDRISPFTKKFVDTTGGMVATARRICFSKEKKQWITDFTENLGENIIFFVNYIDEENGIEEIGNKLKVKVWRIDGTHHNIPDENTIGSRDIVVANFGSGAEALNLQFIHHSVFVSYNWSYSKSVQARGRTKRIGQKHPVFYWYLECEKTIDRDVRHCLKNKSDFAADVWCAEQGLTKF